MVATMFLLSGMSNLIVNYLYGTLENGNWVSSGTIGAIVDDDNYMNIL